MNAGESRSGLCGIGLAFAFALSVLSSGAYAQTQTPATPIPSAAALPPVAEKPAPAGGIPVGPLVVYPAIDYQIGHNDNLYFSNINKGSSTFSVLSPSIRVEGRPGPHKFDITYRMDDGRYNSSAADNYTDYSLLGNADFVITGRAGLKLRGEYRYGHDPRGSTDRGGSATPDEYVNQGVGGIFSYGAPGARGRIEIDGGAFQRRYQNNRATTIVSDHDTNNIGATFLWKIAPKTELLAQAEHIGIDYTLPTSTQDSTEMHYLLGAKWEATAKTAGIVKFGWQNKKFDSGIGRTNYGGSNWEGTVRWSPLTYSIWDFTTSKSTNESTGTGDFLLTSLYGATWNHAWNSRFSSAAQANWRKDEFLGTGGGRVDKTSTMGLRLTYQWQRWLRFGGEYTYVDRVSNPNTFDYTRHQIMFTVGATL